MIKLIKIKFKNPQKLIQTPKNLFKTPINLINKNTRPQKFIQIIHFVEKPIQKPPKIYSNNSFCRETYSKTHKNLFKNPKKFIQNTPKDKNLDVFHQQNVYKRAKKEAFYEQNNRE